MRSRPAAVLGLIAAAAGWHAAIGAAGWTQESAGSVLSVSPEPELSRDGQMPWEPWLAASVEAVATISGRYPAGEVDVHLEATRSSGPIAYGRVVRSQPPRIHFYVSADAELDELKADWRGFHEFAHLLLPYPGSRDVWFSEGMASYYQYLLMARAGVVEPDQAWEALVGGFQRGLNDPVGRGWSLRKLAPEMSRKRAYRRVYWTGAAYFLRVDTRLRLESEGRHSVDSALAAFQECCLDNSRNWNARRLIDKLGELSIPEIWDQEYQRMIDAPAEPEFSTAFEHLGITLTGRRGIRFEDAGAALRRAIAMGSDDPAIPESQPPSSRKSR